MAVAQSVILLSQIRPPRYRLRKELGDLEELKKSIHEKGLLHAITVRKVGEKFEIVSGHRRYICLLELGRKELVVSDEVKIVAADDREAFEFGLIENLDRREMDAIEEAQAFKAYVMDYGWGSITELANRIHRTQPYVSKRIELLRLPEENYSRLMQKGLSSEHAFELSRLTESHSNDQLSKITEEIADKGLDRDQTRKVVNLVKHGYEIPDAIQRTLDFPELPTPAETDFHDPVEDAREQIALAVGKLLTQVDFSLEHMPDGEEKSRWVTEVRFPVHELKSKILALRRKYKPKEIW